MYNKKTLQTESSNWLQLVEANKPQRNKWKKDRRWNREEQSDFRIKCLQNVLSEGLYYDGLEWWRVISVLICIFSYSRTKRSNPSNGLIILHNLTLPLLFKHSTDVSGGVMMGYALWQKKFEIPWIFMIDWVFSFSWVIWQGFILLTRHFLCNPMNVEFPGSFNFNFCQSVSYISHKLQCGFDGL